MFITRYNFIASNNYIMAGKAQHIFMSIPIIVNTDVYNFPQNVSFQEKRIIYVRDWAPQITSNQK